MNTANALYQEAVRFAEQADIAKFKQPKTDYKALYQQAAALEKQAAMLMAADEKGPLNKAAMLRSAAALAFKGGNFGESEKLIALARAQTPDAFEALKLDEIERAILELVPAQPNLYLTILGTFSAANADESEIVIRDLANRQAYIFFVPAKMFRKIVKSHWLDVVQVVGRAGPSGVLTLEKIGPAA